MQKIFLTGSTGFLGTKFIELYGDEYEILGVSRTDKNHPLDLLDFDAVGEMFRDFAPDFVIHTAEDLGEKPRHSPTTDRGKPSCHEQSAGTGRRTTGAVYFTSTESVYGGKETGNYRETDEPRPRNHYAESKALSEKDIMAASVPYLIIRPHRFVGVSQQYTSSHKQFPDTLNALRRGDEVHLDSSKLFMPSLINHMSDVFVHYMRHDASRQVLVNVCVDHQTTFFEFMRDIAQALDISTDLVHPDGEEKLWPASSTVSMDRFKELGYPNVTYQEMLAVIQADFRVLGQSED